MGSKGVESSVMGGLGAQQRWVASDFSFKCTPLAAVWRMVGRVW